MTGVINIYKEKGYTSHDVVAIIRRIVGTKKVGHTGTLDPDATGVLPVCIGRATKLADFFATQDKTYIAQIILGLETTTGDISGEIINKQHINFDRDAIAKAVMSFHFDVRGQYMQTPPMYSAIKIGGKKLYELARKGQTIDIPPRPVIIHDISVQNFDQNHNAFTILVKCSKGTYIRSLAVDIGRTLGCGATMGELERVQSGMFHINCPKYPALKLDEIKETAQNGQLPIIPIEELLPYPRIHVEGVHLTAAKNGNPLPMPDETKGKKFWVYGNSEIIGLFEANGNDLARPVVML